MITLVGWVWGICLLLCASLFAGMGVYSLKAKEPTHFWSGSKVESTEIINVKRYNGDNAAMWFIYSVIFIVIGIIGFVGKMLIAGIMLGVMATAGIVALIFIYNAIYKKYSVKREVPLDEAETDKQAEDIGKEDTAEEKISDKQTGE